MFALRTFRVVRGYALLLSALCLARPAIAQATLVPSFAGVRAAIEQYEVEHPGETLRISDILRQLPADFRSGFVLMRETRSIQGASDRAPRVLMFGDDARTVMTFNGEPSQHGFSRLEFASVAPESGRLEFRSIELPDGDTGFGHAKFSEPNPPLCMSCHGPTPHYIWTQYATWPGAYGRRDDNIELTDGEKDAFLAFRESSQAHPRYKSLNYEFLSLSPNYPYRCLAGGENGGDRICKSLALENRPNARFGLLLLRHQAKALVQAAAQSQSFEQFKYGFAFYLAGCDEMSSVSSIQHLYAATGAISYRDYANRFGLPASESWHFEKGAAETNAVDFYAGFSTFRSAVLSALWQDHLVNDETLIAFHVPIRLFDYASTSQRFQLYASNRGLDLWQALDRAGLILSGFPGASEAENLASSEGIQGLSDANVRRACEIFGETQLERLHQ